MLQLPACIWCMPVPWVQTLASTGLHLTRNVCFLHMITQIQAGEPGRRRDSKCSASRLILGLPMVPQEKGLLSAPHPPNGPNNWPQPGHTY